MSQFLGAETPITRAIAGATNTYPVQYSPFDAGHVKVSVNGVVLPESAYTVTIDADGAGGAVALNTPASVGAAVTNWRETPPARATAPFSGDVISADLLNSEFNRLLAIAQEVQEQLSRAITLSRSSTRSGITLADPQAGKVVEWNADGSGLGNSEFTVADFKQARDEATAGAQAAESARDQASAHRLNAGNSATSAATSASNAANSASSMTSSVTSAANSASQAATSETNAANSATNAATSETNAATSETNAATSETNAASSATAAATSASNSADSANRANSYAESANVARRVSAQHVTTTIANKTNAATSETNAATSASNAANSATNAATSASNAASSATAAANSASAPVTTARLADDAITTDKIANDAITTDKIANGAVTSTKLQYDTVTGDHMAPGVLPSTDYGGVGSYVFAHRHTGNTFNPVGNVVPGFGLIPGSISFWAAGGGGHSGGESFYGSDGALRVLSLTSAYALGGSHTLTGSWRSVGPSGNPNSDKQNQQILALYVRIA